MNRITQDGGEGFAAYVPERGPQKGKRMRAVLSALGVSLLFILLYYMSQMFAQFIYAVVLIVSDIVRASSIDGFQATDLQVDVFGVLDRVQQNYTVVAAIYAAMLVVGYSAFIATRRKTIKGYLHTDRLRASHAIAAIAVALGMLGTANLLFEILTWFASRYSLADQLLENYNSVVGNAFVSDAGVGWLILGVCILVPIAEELLFRGIVQGELSKTMSPWLAVVFQAILFSAFHMQPVQSVYVFLPGLAMGLAYMASRSILVPILMHMLFNFLGSGALAGLVGEQPALDTALYAAQYGFILVGALCLAWMFRTRTREPATSGVKGDAGQYGQEDREETI